MRTFLLSALAVITLSLVTPATVSRASTDDFDAWMDAENQISVDRLSANISAVGTRRGTILASPSQHDPNYYYYWVRDGAMVMRAIFDRYAEGDAVAGTQLKDYVQFTRENQQAAASNLGEPRFNVDGAVNTEPWGRPQNDGPALRALTMIRYANALLKAGDRASVERDLYLPELPPRSIIKTDLEYIAHHWQDRCIDLWEEVWGYHFFTQATQVAALREGAKLALVMGDPGASAFYSKTADQIELMVVKHWDESKGYYLSAIDFSASNDHQKASQLDVSVLLAALAVEQDSGILSLTDDHIIKTAVAIESTFASLYPINSSRGDIGTAIGRYSEDVYFGGNPWILTTAAFAEWNYRMASKIAASKHFVLSSTQAQYLGSVVASVSKSQTLLVSANVNIASNPQMRAQVVEALRLRGDAFLKRIRMSAGVTGYLAEQFDLRTGQMMSARDLSWSYASFMRAFKARNDLLSLSIAPTGAPTSR